MKEVDTILEDEHLLDLIYEPLGRRHPQSRKRGRPSTPAEVELRLMVLKQVRNWSYDVLEPRSKPTRCIGLLSAPGHDCERGHIQTQPSLVSRWKDDLLSGSGSRLSGGRPAWRCSGRKCPESAGRRSTSAG